MSAPPDLDHLRLAGVTRLSLHGGRGPSDAFLFDPHRLAFPSWALGLGLGLGDRRPALLLTLDRHFDLVPPANPEQIPSADAPLRILDEYARWDLDVRNYDHVIAAMEAGLVGDVIAVARGRPRGAFSEEAWTDRSGRAHQVVSAPTLDRLCDGFGEPSASPEARQTWELVQRAKTIILDVDLDCFTTMSDADPTEVVPWPRDLIRRHLLPAGSERFWTEVLARTSVLTFAREPAHCGGIIAANRLFEDAAEVLFRELLRTDLP